MDKRNLPPNVYLQSYLQKAGVRFKPNVVDTVCKRGLGFSFFAILLLLASLMLWYVADDSFIRSCPNSYALLVLICTVYELFCILRLMHFIRLRKKLRQDSAPIAVECYAVVLFDVSRFNSKKLKMADRSAILYKELGSKRPRFFTGAISRGIRQTYYKEQLGRVFIDRKNGAMYTVDEDKLYVTVSDRKRRFAKYSVARLEEVKKTMKEHSGRCEGKHENR